MGSDTKWVVFIDSLDENDLSRAEWLPNNIDGKLDARYPRVTPRVMSSIYTGTDPAENGMMRGQMFGQPRTTRPEKTTTMERAMGNDLDVLSFHMPYSIPMNVQPNSAAIGEAGPGISDTRPPSIHGLLNVAGPKGDLIGERRHDIVFDHFVDYTTSLFATARTLAPEYDVVFIGHRLIDSYTHFQYSTNETGRGNANIGERYRDKMAEVVDIEIQQLLPRGDVLFFSDHGATEMTDVFRVNKWLHENGYLNYDVDLDFIEAAKEKGLMGGNEHPAETRVHNQIGPADAGVDLDIDSSKAICSDPYDSAITWLGEDGSDEMWDLIDELNDLDVYRDVYHRSELYNEDGQYYEQTPHIIPDRGKGVFVTGNVHPEPIGMGYHRTGVHRQYGVYGSNTDIGSGTVTPEELNGVVEDFLGLDRETVPIPDMTNKLTEEELKAVNDRHA